MIVILNKWSCLSAFEDFREKDFSPWNLKKLCAKSSPFPTRWVIFARRKEKKWCHHHHHTESSNGTGKCIGIGKCAVSDGRATTHWTGLSSATAARRYLFNHDRRNQGRRVCTLNACLGENEKGEGGLRCAVNMVKGPGVRSLAHFEANW